MDHPKSKRARLDRIAGTVWELRDLYGIEHETVIKMSINTGLARNPQELGLALARLSRREGQA